MPVIAILLKLLAALFIYLMSKIEHEVPEQETQERGTAPKGVRSMRNLRRSMTRRHAR